MLTITLLFTDDIGAAAYARILDSAREAGAILGEVHTDMAAGRPLQEVYKDGKVIKGPEAARILSIHRHPSSRIPAKPLRRVK